jgi:hypothetical protein
VELRHATAPQFLEAVGAVLLGSFKDAVRLREKLANSIGDELLDLQGGTRSPPGDPARACVISGSETEYR